MKTALEKLLEYVENTYQDETLDFLIEDINGICGTIDRIVRKINEIEEVQQTFGSITLEQELTLARLKPKLLQELKSL